ncbi:hypothetical protein FQA39_LY14541 [Lamprigera yunnana]|nr:hypothetical protein FQA39_LY14541 [Lamprigera yunnana]
MRINSITTCPNFVANEPTRSTADNAPLTYSDLATVLNDLPIEDEDIIKFQRRGCFITQGLIVGAQKTGSLINDGTSKLINYMSPATEDKKISLSLIKGFEIASNVSGVAGEASGYFALLSSNSCFRSIFGYSYKKLDTLLLMFGFDMSSKMYGVVTVAVRAVEGFTNILLQPPAGYVTRIVIMDTPKGLQPEMPVTIYCNYLRDPPNSNRVCDLARADGQSYLRCVEGTELVQCTAYFE